MEEKLLEILQTPMKTGEAAAAAGIEKAEADKLIKKLAKEGRVISPKRCYYQTAK